MRFNAAVSGYSPERAQRFYETVIQRASEVTGVKSVAFASGLPMTIDRENPQVVPEGYQFPPGRESAEVLTYVVDHHYFDTFGVPPLAGRSFRAMDRADSPPVVIVNEAFAKQYLGPNPIGKRIRLADRNGMFAEVVVST